MHHFVCVTSHLLDDVEDYNYIDEEPWNYYLPGLLQSHEEILNWTN